MRCATDQPTANAYRMSVKAASTIKSSTATVSESPENATRRTSTARLQYLRTHLTHDRQNLVDDDFRLRLSEMAVLIIQQARQPEA